jgi:hypothetical protein
LLHEEEIPDLADRKRVIDLSGKPRAKENSAIFDREATDPMTLRVQRGSRSALGGNEQLAAHEHALVRALRVPEQSATLRIESGNPVFGRDVDAVVVVHHMRRPDAAKRTAHMRPPESPSCFVQASDILVLDGIAAIHAVVGIGCGRIDERTPGSRRTVAAAVETAFAEGRRNR